MIPSVICVINISQLIFFWQTFCLPMTLSMNSGVSFPTFRLTYSMLSVKSADEQNTLATYYIRLVIYSDLYVDWLTCLFSVGFMRTWRYRNHEGISNILDYPLSFPDVTCQRFVHCVFHSFKAKRLWWWNVNLMTRFVTVSCDSYRFFFPHPPPSMTQFHLKFYTVLLALNTNLIIISHRTGGSTEWQICVYLLHSVHIFRTATNNYSHYW